MRRAISSGGRPLICAASSMFPRRRPGRSESSISPSAQTAAENPSVSTISRSAPARSATCRTAGLLARSGPRVK